MLLCLLRAVLTVNVPRSSENVADEPNDRLLFAPMCSLGDPGEGSRVDGIVGPIVFSGESSELVVNFRKKIPSARLYRRSDNLPLVH